MIKTLKRNSCFLLLFFFLGVVGLLHGDLTDFYKRGTIKVDNEADPEFGKNTDWDELFYKGISDMTIAPDGRLFVSASHQHKIIVLDKNGNYLKSFGQEGQGPGDFISPSFLSILDKKFLVVTEYGSNMRINLFDLDTHFNRLFRTTLPPYNCVSVGDSSLAFVNYRYINEGNYKITQSLIVIRDIHTNKDLKITEFEKKEKNTTIMATHFYGRAFIQPFKNKTLLVGFSSSPEISFYTTTGQKVGSFNVQMERLEVTGEMKENHKKRLENFSTRQPLMKPYLKEFKHTGFPDYTPYYQWLTVDPANHILVFVIEDIEYPSSLFHVYDPQGQKICQTRFVFNHPFASYPRIIQEDALYFTVTHEDEWVYSRIIKIKIK